MMKQLANRFTASFGMAGAIASAVLFAFPAFAQDSRLSLADRVTQLEQRAQNKDQGGTGMVNQMQQLQAQVQQLQGQIEELQHHLRQLDDKNKAQYVDLDSRLGRLEGGGTGAGNAAGNASPGGTQQTAPVAAGSTAAADSGAAGSASAPDPADPAAAQAAYDVAFKAIRGGDYVGASREFRSFIQHYPDHALTPNALYWLGESYYATANYPVAVEAFQRLLSQFPQSDKAPGSLLKIGYSQLELKQSGQGKATLADVITNYPTSDAASLAQERLSRLQRQGN